MPSNLAICSWLENTRLGLGISQSIWIFPAIEMFVAEATKCYNSAPFRLKMLMMVLAGVNALIFHSFAYRGVKCWELGSTPYAAKFAGALSLIFWFGIVGAGRWIAFY